MQQRRKERERGVESGGAVLKKHRQPPPPPPPLFLQAFFFYFYPAEPFSHTFMEARCALYVHLPIYSKKVGQRRTTLFNQVTGKEE